MQGREIAAEVSHRVDDSGRSQSQETAARALLWRSIYVKVRGGGHWKLNEASFWGGQRVLTGCHVYHCLNTESLQA